MKKDKKGGRNNPINANTNLFNNTENRRAVPITDILKQTKKYTAREKKLKEANMTWAMGLEHESQFFYTPTDSFNYLTSLDEIVLFDTLQPTTFALNNIPTLPEKERQLLLKLDFELTGRKCHGKTVLEKIPVPMPEFITENPFSDMDNPKTIANYYNQLIEKEDDFLKILRKVPYVRDFADKQNVHLSQYPFAMCSNIRVRKNYENDSPQLEKEKYVDYLGSFHFTVTLPFSKKEKYSPSDQKKFVDMHYNFGAMFQWIEPLLLAAFFSTDQDAVGSKETRIKGSFRVARVGWGNFAGSDMSNANKNIGVGRYANVYPYWRKNFEFYQSNIVDECLPANPKLKESQAVSSFSSNIRTFGEDPNEPSQRISGAKMEIPNGVEIRIFDHFQSINLLPLLQIIILVAANSMEHKVDKFVYKDEDWIKTIRKIMLQGWKANVEFPFIKKLEDILKITISPKSERAYDVLVAIVDALYVKNKDSDVVFMMYGNLEKPFVPMINKYSWDLAFMLKIVKDETVYKNLLKFIEFCITNTVVDNLVKNVPKYFGENWKNDGKDILWFLEGKKLITISGGEYKINVEMMKDFIKLENIKREITIQLNFKDFLYNIKKNISKGTGFFNNENVLKRYEKLFDYKKSHEIQKF